MDSDSTDTSIDNTEENFCENPTRDILAEGIISLFKPTVDRLDESVTECRSAQQDLSEELNQLLEQLNKIESYQKDIPDLSEKVRKLIEIKDKITVITNVLQTSQERLQKLHKLIEREQIKYQEISDSKSALSN